MGEIVLVPKWLKIQRLSLLLFSLCGVLLLPYALGFLSNAYIFYAFGDVSLRSFYQDMQGINTGLLFKAVLAIIMALLLLMIQPNNMLPENILCA
jgi:succinate dehydrogenase/fumarate reductase cytochrome b subunit